MEAYTSILGIPKERLEKFYGKEVIEADRDLVEQEAEIMINAAKNSRVAFLVVGDVFGFLFFLFFGIFFLFCSHFFILHHSATTHTDLWLRCNHENIDVQVVHNASIMNAVACSGLQLYHFGETISMCFFTPTWRPDSFYEKIKLNRQRGQHTLCLLDIKVKEQSEENFLRNRKIYEPPRFMTVNQCVEQLLEIEEKRKENGKILNQFAN